MLYLPRSRDGVDVGCFVSYCSQQKLKYCGLVVVSDSRRRHGSRRC